MGPGENAEVPQASTSGGRLYEAPPLDPNTMTPKEKKTHVQNMNKMDSYNLKLKEEGEAAQAEEFTQRPPQEPKKNIFQRIFTRGQATNPDLKVSPDPEDVRRKLDEQAKMTLKGPGGINEPVGGTPRQSGDLPVTLQEPSGPTQ